MKPSTRLNFAKHCIYLGFITIWISLIPSIEKDITLQVIESMGWFLLTIGGGYMGTKVAEHGTSFMKKPDA